MNEELLERVQIRRLDVFSLFHDVAADATHFGFVDIAAPCRLFGP
jgi:phospholipase/lecithinase/hemolysin